MVFQNYALYPHMTVYQNMALSLKIRKVKKDEMQRRVREAAEVLHLEDILTSGRASSPGGSANGWRWGGRSSASRRRS